MNRIEAVETQTENLGEYLELHVDGVSLDRMISNLEGLVPALLGYMSNEAEREIAWQRFLPETGSTSIAPMLICPDCLDFWCSTIVAEVVAESHLVHWTRLGSDVSSLIPIDAVGTSVEWLAGIGPFTFDRKEYERCKEDFRPIFYGEPFWGMQE